MIFPRIDLSNVRVRVRNEEWELNIGLSICSTAEDVDRGLGKVEMHFAGGAADRSNRAETLVATSTFQLPNDHGKGKSKAKFLESKPGAQGKHTAQQLSQVVLACSVFLSLLIQCSLRSYQDQHFEDLVSGASWWLACGI